jgi:tetratricopeptide (TPR) repeat protein
VLHYQGRYEEAEEMYRDALARRGEVLGPNHPETLTSVRNLALLLSSRRRFDEAIPLLERAYTGSRNALGDDHPATINRQTNYADALQKSKRHAREKSPPESHVKA